MLQKLLSRSQCLFLHLETFIYLSCWPSPQDLEPAPVTGTEAFQLPALTSITRAAPNLCPPASSDYDFPQGHAPAEAKPWHHYPPPWAPRIRSSSLQTASLPGESGIQENQRSTMLLKTLSTSHPISSFPLSSPEV